MVTILRAFAVVGALASSVLAAAGPFSVNDNVNGRSGPGTSYSIVKTYSSGSKVSVICQSTGTSVNGDSYWNLVSQNPTIYVADYYVSTGGRTRLSEVPICGSGGSGGDGQYPTNDNVNGRSGPGTQYSVVKSYSKGTKLSVRCQSAGESIDGLNVWDQVEPNVWIFDKYLSTGGKTWLPGVPRCSGGGGGDGGDGGSGGGGSGGGQRIIEFAKKQFGWPYSWGGGNYNGASYGIDDSGNYDSDVKGFDCSGLTLYAVYQATGKKIDHYTGSQYQDSRGRKIPYSEKQPGDLIYWSQSSSDKANGRGNRHVAIYVGGSTTIDAYSHGTPLGYRNLDTAYNNNLRMPYVIRFW